MKRPERPSDPRDGEPYYIDSECPKCGTKLEQLQEAKEKGWHDEWICPKCDDGVHMDWPEAEFRKLRKLVERVQSTEDTGSRKSYD